MLTKKFEIRNPKHETSTKFECSKFKTTCLAELVNIAVFSVIFGFLLFLGGEEISPVIICKLLVMNEFSKILKP